MKLHEIWFCLLWINIVKGAVCPDGSSSTHYSTYASLHEEGERVSLTCQFAVPVDCGPITWGKIPSGQPIIPSTRIRIDDVTNDTALYSTLSIDPVSVRDEGVVFCNVKQLFNHFYIKVIPLPKVVISPLYKAVEEGRDVIFTCNVTNKDQRLFNDTYKWCRGSIDLQDSMHADNMSVSRLYLPNVAMEDSGQYSCGVHGYGDACANMKHFSILEVYRTEGTKFCQEDFDDATGLTWAAIPAGSTIKQPCMSNFTGVIQRSCRADGVWGVVATIGCVRQEIQSALEDLIHLETTPGNTEVVIGNVITSIADITTNPASLTSGDLNSTTAVLTKIVDIMTNSAETVDVNEQKFVGIIDDLLAEDSQATWAEVNDKSSDAVASNLMKIIEDFGLVFSRTVTIDNPIILNKTNINVEFRRTDLTTHVINFYPDQILNGTEVGISLSLDPDIAGNITYTAAFYRTISAILPQSKSYEEFASEVISLSIGSEIETHHLASPVMLAFDTDKLKEKNNLSDELSITCVFWDFGIKQWSSDGCRRVNNSCQCDHLTNFAVLMSPVQILDDMTLISLRLITIVGCSISVAGTLLTMLTYLGLWRHVKNDQARLLMNLCAALTVAYVLFLTGIDKTGDSILCTVMAALLHYFFLATFCLMLAEGIILLMSVTVVFYSKSKLKWLLLLGWGTPAIVVGTTIGITYEKEYHSQHHCWLTLSNGVLYAFVGPAIAIILVNVAVIIRVQKAIYSSHFIVTKTQRQKLMTGARSISILLPVLGVTWLFGVLAVNADLVVFQYIFAIANSLQGFFIFLSYCVCSVPIRRALERKIKLLTSAAFSSKDDFKLQVIRTKPTNFTAAKYPLTNGIPTPFKKATNYQQASLARRYRSFSALPNYGLK